MIDGVEGSAQVQQKQQCHRTAYRERVCSFGAKPLTISGLEFAIRFVVGGILVQLNESCNFLLIYLKLRSRIPAYNVSEYSDPVQLS